MASPQSLHQTPPLKHTTNNLYYTPSPTNASFGYLSVGMQSTIPYMVTPPIPLVSLPSPSSNRDTKPVAEAIHVERAPVVEDELTVIGFIDRSAQGRWWIDSEVKWSGYVEYPVSCVRSSIAREAGHRVNVELEMERKSRERL